MTSTRLIAQELRALALTGLAYGQNPYDVDRFRRVLHLSAELAALDSPASVPEVGAAYLQNLAHISPLFAAEAVVVRADRVLLIRRHDSGLWGLPGGMAEVGETPAGAAQRELFEETGLTGQATRLLGLLDSRYAPNLHGLHLISPIFLIAANGEPHATLESREVGWFAWDDLPPLHPGHERSLQVAREALRTGIPFFDPEPTRPLQAQEGSSGKKDTPQHWKVKLARLLVRGGGFFLLKTKPEKERSQTPF